jgi:LPPG:FO 2-phospho-L-lactate transferase
MCSKEIIVIIMDHYLLLAGGIGAAKFIVGLVNVVEPQKLKIIVNTGDDIELFGLKICPDIDIITYTIAGLVDKNKGWGYEDETYNCLNLLKKFYAYGWFSAGDKDLATHIYRTDLFKQGYNKTEITSIISEKLGVKAQIIPMCNDDVQTYIDTFDGLMHFEEYYIKYRCEPDVKSVKYIGIENARASNEIINFIREAKKIIICPSNPIVSIGTILSVPGIKNALKKEKKKVYGISPIIQGSAIKGPADKLMKTLGLEVSCLGVAKYYSEILSNFVIDLKDSKLEQAISELGIKTYCFDTIMDSIMKKLKLAQYLIKI